MANVIELNAHRSPADPVDSDAAHRKLNADAFRAIACALGATRAALILQAETLAALQSQTLQAADLAEKK